MKTLPISLELSLKALKAGRPIVLIDDECRENEGDLVFAAQTITQEQVNFLAQEGRGLICASLPEELAQKLQLTPMCPSNTAIHQTAFTISVDHQKTSTGISASDRALTLRELANPFSRPQDFLRPGHIFPLVARKGGVLVRPGHTEGSVDLIKMLDLHRGEDRKGQGPEIAPVAVICEILSPEGGMLRGKDLETFASRHNLPLLSIKTLIEYRKTFENWIIPSATTKMPTKAGEFILHNFENKYNPEECHFALSLNIENVNSSSSLMDPIPLVRIHSECVTGEALGSLRCDCGQQLESSLKQIQERGIGCLVYLKQEGRGIGLKEKIKAYALQDQGLDTVEANLKLGHQADQRDYFFALKILEYFGMTKIDFLTNNPEKIKFVEEHSAIEIKEVLPLYFPPNEINSAYYQTKKTYFKHNL